MYSSNKTEDDSKKETKKKDKKEEKKKDKDKSCSTAPDDAELELNRAELLSRMKKLLKERNGDTDDKLDAVICNPTGVIICCSMSSLFLTRRGQKLKML